jgi:cation diffusion facilitator CzcD-associated flavoprotein CzcO
VIGCGSTGVQIVTVLQKRSAQVVHFQRSPQWIMPVEQFDYTEAERAAFRANPQLIDELRYGEQYWSAIYRFNRALVDPEGTDMHEIEALCRQNLEHKISDPVLREKLRPNYRAACKRLIYSWNYYDAVQQPNVTVEIGAIECVEPGGIRMRDGSFHELDVIVLATGFKADRFIRPAVVKGKGGVCLDDKWKGSPSAYYAITIPGMPNFFMLNGPTGPVGNFSLIDIAERQWGYIEQLLQRLRSGTAAEIAPTAEAMADYDSRRVTAARRTIFASGCTSWYLNADGVPITWPWSYQSFADEMENPRFEDYELA